MRAVRSYRKEFVSAPRQDHVFGIDHPDNHAAIGQRVERNAVFQIRFCSVFHVCHEDLPARSMHESNIPRLSRSVATLSP